MREVVLILAFLVAGCAGFDAAEDQSVAARAFTATFENDVCRLQLELGPSTPIVDPRMELQEVWRLDTWIEPLPGQEEACLDQHRTTWLDGDMRIVRDRMEFCFPDCGHILSYQDRGALAPWGVHWPPAGPTTTALMQNPVNVTIVEKNGWRSLAEPVRPDDRVSLHIRGDGPVPEAVGWAYDGRLEAEEVFHRTRLTFGEPLPALAPPEDQRTGRQALQGQAPGARLNVYNVGWTLEDFIDKARSDDAVFDRILADGCLSFAGKLGAGRGEFLPDFPLGPAQSGERFDLTLTARNEHEVRSVEIQFSEERVLSQPVTTEQETLNGQQPTKPGACLDLDWDGTTIEEVRDGLWNLPLVEDQLPCSWYLHRTEPLHGQESMLIHVSFDGYADTGTFWASEFRSVKAMRWASATYDVSHGWASFFGLTEDEIRDLDDQRPGQRVPFTHDDRFMTWCRFVGGEPGLPVPPVPPATA